MVGNIHYNGVRMNLEKLKDFMYFNKLTKRMVIVPWGMSFRWCNNKCEFCYLKAGWENTIRSLDFFEQVKNNIISTLPDLLLQLPQDTIIELDYAGGEIFCLGDEYYRIYFELLAEYHKICKEHQFNKLHISFSTNLILNNHQIYKLIELCNKCEQLGLPFDITTSFDLWGRFESEDVANLWWNNILILNKNIKVKPRVEMVLCKPSIDIYLKNEQTFTMDIFTKILENPDKVMFFFENYVPNSPENIKLVPSNEDKINMFKKLIDLYWGTLPMLDAYRSDYNIEITKEEDKPQYQDCSSAFYGDSPIENWMSNIEFFDNETPLYSLHNCIDRALGLWPKSAQQVFKSKIDLLKPGTFLGDGYMCLNHLDKVNNFYINKFGCGNCKFKQYCYKNNLRGCYVEHNFIWSSDKCWKREVFKYAENLHR